MGVTISEDRKPKPYTLDCHHIIYLRVSPHSSDQLWCSKCDSYQPLLLAAGTTHGRIYDPQGEFWSERKGKSRHVKGHCMYPECGYEHVSVNFNVLEKHMHEHYMRRHTNWGSKIVIVERSSKLPPGSPAPF